MINCKHTDDIETKLSTWVIVGLLSVCKSELVQISNLWVKRVTKLNC